MAAQQPLIKPEQVDGLPGISDDQKRSWKNGLTGLWTAFNGSPDGSQAKNEARSKIMNASGKIMQAISQRNKPGTAQRPPQQGQGGGQGVQPQMAQQGGVQGQQGAQPAPNHQQPQQPQPSSQGETPQQSQQALQAQMAQMQARVKQAVHKIQIFPEPGTSSNQQFASYRESFKQRYGNALLKSERAQFELGRLQQTLKQMQNNSGTVPEDQKTKFRNLQEMYRAEQQNVTNLETENEQNRKEYAAKQAKNQQDQQNGQAAAGNTQSSGAQPQNTSRPSTQQGQTHGDVKMEQQMSNSPQQPQGQFPQQPQAQNAGTPVQHQTTQQHSQPPPAQPQNQGTPQNTNQPQLAQPNFAPNNMVQQQPQMPQQQAHQQQQRPPMNPQQNGQQTQYAQHPYPNPAQPNIPQNGMPNAQNQRPQQVPQPLTQQAAMAQAAQTYTQNNQQTPTANQPQQQPMQQPHANMPNGLPFQNPPPSATQQHTPTGGTGFPPSQQINSSQSKFPIPKNLNLDPRTQQPVPAGPARPSFQPGGMSNMPGVQKPPPFTLEGEGDHVLSKRKLDELVRQITGSTNPADNLSPEVEEAVLSMTDNFVDNVIQKACQLAKLRAGQTLDIRDVQMVLERNYGIRIPGYSLDEVRTVRKFQPAPGWVGKVQAVQAGKVMGGSKDT